MIIAVRHTSWPRLTLPVPGKTKKALPLAEDPRGVGGLAQEAHLHARDGVRHRIGTAVHRRDRDRDRLVGVVEHVGAVGGQGQLEQRAAETGARFDQGEQRASGQIEPSQSPRNQQSRFADEPVVGMRLIPAAAFAVVGLLFGVAFGVAEGTAPFTERAESGEAGLGTSARVDRHGEAVDLAAQLGLDAEDLNPSVRLVDVEREGDQHVRVAG